MASGSGIGNVFSKKNKGKGKKEVRAVNIGETEISKPTRTHKATIVWLHDIDNTGNAAIGYLRKLGLPNVKWICPTAPIRPITSLGGNQVQAWCNITKVSESMQHDYEALDQLNLYVADLLSTEPKNVIRGVGGVGLGAAAALYFATTYAFGHFLVKGNLQLVVGINGWLPGLASLDYKMNSAFGTFNRASSLQILLTHGTSDDVVPTEFINKCVVSLMNTGFPTMFKQCGGDHVPNEIRVWLAQKFGI